MDSTSVSLLNIPPLPPLPTHTTRPNGLVHLQNDFDHPCAHCAKLGATMVCRGCKIHHIGLIQTCYCTENCQEADWENHKLVCIERQKFGRAVGIMCQVWDQFSRLTFTHMYQFQRADGRFVYLVPRNGPVSTRALTGDSIFYPFPGDVVPETSRTDVINAVLHDNMCVDILSTGLPLIMSLLQPVCHTISEVSVLPKDPALQVLKNNVPDNVDHMVLYARLNSNEEFAVDVTGAQFGWQERIYPWENYLRYRGSFRVSVPLGWSRQFATESMKGALPESIARCAFDIRRRIAKDGAESILNFFHTNHTTVNKFVSRSNSSFDAQREAMIREVEVTIRQSIHNVVLSRGIGRSCLLFEGVNSRPIAVRTEDLARKLERVWFTHEEIQASEGRLGDLVVERYFRLQRDGI